MQIRAPTFYGKKSKDDNNKIKFPKKKKKKERKAIKEFLQNKFQLFLDNLIKKKKPTQDK